MEVTVEAGSRLHAGFHVIGDRMHGIDYAGAGFYAMEPRLRLTAIQCGEAEYRGPGEFRDPVISVIKKLDANVCVRLEEAPPRHAGLGSTTQVMLATYHAIAVLQGGNPAPSDLVEAGLHLLGRRIASSVGTILYAYGGFASGIGVPPPQEYYPIRLEIPEDWRFIIVVPEARRGLNEEEELRLLSPARPAAPKISALMSRGFHYLLLGVARRDLNLALEGLNHIQSATGLYFSKVQGGVYRSDLALIADEASRDGIVVAQSSWGPVLYTITTWDSSDSDRKTLKSIMRELGVRGEVIVSRPRNRGGTVSRLEG